MLCKILRLLTLRNLCYAQVKNTYKCSQFIISGNGFD